MSQRTLHPTVVAPLSGPPRASRAELYRQRAAVLETQIELLAPDQRQSALQQQQALLLLAEVEEWVAVPRSFPSSYDYKLTPRASPAPQKQRAPKRKHFEKV